MGQTPANSIPRGVSNIVIGVVYHLPNAVNSTMLDYLSKCLGDLESRYPNCGIFVLGDLNKLSDTRLKSNFNLKQIVQFSTRGQNTLDKVLTNLEDYYAPPIKRSALGLSDDSSVEVQPKQRVSTSQLKQTVISRDLRSSNRHAMQLYLEQVDVAAKIAAEESCERKVSMLQTILQTGLDIILPLKSKTIYPNQPLWINSTLKKLIKKRQRALNQGDHAEFKLLRNRVNRECKMCHSKYYKCRVQHLTWQTMLTQLS